jgi:hypothetical protein
MADQATRDVTAVHEAGHGVIQVVLGLGPLGITIAPAEVEREACPARQGGEFDDHDSDAEMLRAYAEEAFWLRHAMALYAGAEAVRQLRPLAAGSLGAESDARVAVEAIHKITDDPASCELLFALAMRRCETLVDHYRPEIEAVAAALLERGSLVGSEVERLIRASLDARRPDRFAW